MYKHYNFYTIILFCLICLLDAQIAFSAAKKLPVPRFVSVKFNEVNVRTGPAWDCPIDWVFVKTGEPLEIIAEYDHWRKIRDVTGDTGWIHSTTLSTKRFVVIVAQSAINLFSDTKQNAKILAKIMPQTRCALIKCSGQWCNINCQSYKGWIARKFLWGIYPEEA